MTDEIKGAVADALHENAAGNNITPTELANRRLKQLTPEVPQEEPKEEVQESSEEVEASEETKEEAEAAAEQVADEVTSEVASEAEPESEENVLSQYNLDEMSEDDLRELADKLGSRAVARFGELTARRKAAEEKLAQMEASLKQQKALVPKEPVKDNPYDNLSSIEEIQEKAKEVEDVINWAEETLFNADGYAADDIVTEVEGKELSKAEVRNALLNARKGRNVFLPDRLQKLQVIETASKAKDAFAEKAKEELSWLTGEDNDVRHQYEAMINDQRFQDLEKSVEPDIAAQLPYILAHAANSIYGRKTITQKPSSGKVSLNPPSTGASSAPTASRASKNKKALADLNSRFKGSGDRGDFIKLRTLQLQR